MFLKKRYIRDPLTYFNFQNLNLAWHLNDNNEIFWIQLTPCSQAHFHHYHHLSALIRQQIQGLIS